MGAGVFHGRVRDGIGWIIPRHSHQVVRAIRVSGEGGGSGVCGLVRVGGCMGLRGGLVWMTAVRVYGVGLSLLGD